VTEQTEKIDTQPPQPGRMFMFDNFNIILLVFVFIFTWLVYTLFPILKPTLNNAFQSFSEYISSNKH